MSKVEAALTSQDGEPSHTSSSPGELRQFTSRSDATLSVCPYGVWMFRFCGFRRPCGVIWRFPLPLRRDLWPPLGWPARVEFPLRTKFGSKKGRIATKFDLFLYSRQPSETPAEETNVGRWLAYHASATQT